MKKQNQKKVATLGDVVKQIGEYTAVTNKSFDDIRNQIDELAVVTSKGFDHVDKRFEEMEIRFEKRFGLIDKRFEAIDKRFVEIERRLDKIWVEVGTMRRDIYDIKTEMIRREEFEHLMARVEFLEKKLKVHI